MVGIPRSAGVSDLLPRAYTVGSCCWNDAHRSAAAAQCGRLALRTGREEGRNASGARRGRCRRAVLLALWGNVLALLGRPSPLGADCRLALPPHVRLCRSARLELCSPGQWCVACAATRAQCSCAGYSARCCSADTWLLQSEVGIGFFFWRRAFDALMRRARGPWRALAGGRESVWFCSPRWLSFTRRSPLPHAEALCFYLCSSFSRTRTGI